MKIGFYPGSFDPLTNGHMLVIRKASKLFDELYVGIGVNKNKKRYYSKEDMKRIMELVLKREKLDNVKVVVYDELSVDCAKRVNATYLVRGIRNGMDYDYEENLASINEEISGLDTIYIRAGKLGVISSSFVRSLINNHKDIKDYVPSEMNDYLGDTL